MTFNTTNIGVSYCCTIGATVVLSQGKFEQKSLVDVISMALLRLSYHQGKIVLRVENSERHCQGTRRHFVIILLMVELRLHQVLLRIEGCLHFFRKFA